MAHPSLKKLAKLDPASQSKTLIAQFPGRTGILFDHGKLTPMKFTGSIAALKWCERNRAAFYYLPAASHAHN